MYYVYILKSKRDGKCYFGSTINLKQRFKLHNDGRVFSTRYRRPLKLVYYEAYLSEKDARKREQMLKNYGQGITNIYKRIENSLRKKVQGK
jgi:putative endonuclease